jgi:hypothetical protein
MECWVINPKWKSRLGSALSVAAWLAIYGEGDTGFQASGNRVVKCIGYTLYPTVPVIVGME